MKYPVGGLVWPKSMAGPLKVAPADPETGTVVSMVHVVPAQSVNVDVPDPIKVELICSRIELDSMLCVLSILFRLFVAIAPMINPIIPNEVIIRIAPATINSIIVMPAWGSLFFLSAITPSMLNRLLILPAGESI
jgi:hypothetical protein